MARGGGTSPEILEETQLGCVLPTSLGTNSLKKSSWGFLFTGIVGGTLVAVYAVATPFLTPALRKVCLPFVPATTKQIANVVKMLHCRRGSLVDIGSGDGRIVIAAAKEGFTAVGYELNPWLVWYSRYRAWREGVQDSAKFYISDLWKVTFSQYSNVVIFGVPQMVKAPVFQPGPSGHPDQLLQTLLTTEERQRIYRKTSLGRMGGRPSCLMKLRTFPPWLARPGTTTLLLGGSGSVSITRTG
ncbi:ATP synthase subunit C lysine N-methyltransferase isoform X1 [Vulpes vulpes]|uniref:ATP synthase subunit C lysine N-methyltransferase isoform X1 n=1 Tax=Vulpes vulpes TaxID=9627 RepID=A0ABM5A1Y6_VULVU